MPDWIAEAIVLPMVMIAVFAVRSLADEPKPASHCKTDPKTWRWPKVVISKETTYFTEPLRPDGGVDYVAALNRKYSQGVTPENNAAVALWRAAGPAKLDPKIRKRYFELLGIKELPEDGEYSVDAWDLPESDKKPNVHASKMASWPVLEQLCYANEHSWTNTDFPLLALTLHRNEKPLRILTQRLPHLKFFTPLVPLNGSSEITGRLAKDVGSETTSDLSLQAMYQGNDAAVTDKWRDAMLLYWLERHLSQRCFLPDWLLAVGVSQPARLAAAAISQNNNITVNETRECQRQLLELPPMQSLESICDVGERCYAIEMMMRLASAKDARDLFDVFDPETEKHEERKAAFKRLLADDSVDWTEFLRSFNKGRNRLVAALKSPITNQTFVRLVSLQKEAQERSDAATDWVLAAKADPARPLTPQSKAVCLADLMEPCYVFFYRPSVRTELKRQADENLVLLALALAGYRVEHQGGYPTDLAALAPKYIDVIPKDPMTGGDLIYRSNGNGYLMYSVGYNRRDDGGRGSGNMPESVTMKQRFEWDDIVIRTPQKMIESRPAAQDR